MNESKHVNVIANMPTDDYYAGIFQTDTHLYLNSAPGEWSVFKRVTNDNDAVYWRPLGTV